MPTHFADIQHLLHASLMYLNYHPNHMRWMVKRIKIRVLQNISNSHYFIRTILYYTLYDSPLLSLTKCTLSGRGG